MNDRTVQTSGPAAAPRAFRDRLSTPWHLLGLSLAVFLFFAPAFWVWFYQDDFVWLRFGVGFEQGWQIAFTTITGAGTYRPLTQQVYFGVIRQLFDLHATVFHVVGITLHWISTLLAYFILRRLVRRPLAACLGALFFGIHYAHLLSVYWLSAFTDTGLVFCQLLGFWAYMRYLEAGGKLNYGLSLLALALGILSKESAVTMPFLLALYTIFARRKRKLWHLLPHMVMALGYVAVRFAIGVFPRGPYKPEWGWSIVPTLVEYYQRSFGLYDLALATHYINETGLAVLTIVLCVLLPVFVLLRFRATHWPAFGMLYFVAAMGPYLIYPHHITNYYLTVALLGLAIAVAGFFDYWLERPRPGWLRGALLSVVLLYVGATAVEYYAFGGWLIQRSQLGRRLFQDASLAFRRVPEGCAVHVRGANDDSYFALLHDNGLYVAGFLGPVYIAPWRDNILDLDVLYALTPERRASISCLAEVELLGDHFQVREIVGSPPLNSFDPDSQKHPIRIRFTPDKVRSGAGEYSIEVPEMVNESVDLLYTFRGGRSKIAASFCRLDGAGRARISVPAGLPPGIVRVVGVRRSGQTIWLAAEGSIEIVSSFSLFRLFGLR